MPSRYVISDYFFNARRHVTYVTNQPDNIAPGLPPDSTDNPTASSQAITPVNLDAMIAKKREKARRMKQR